jgi:RHS repeat-associated protein
MQDREFFLSYFGARYYQYYRNYRFLSPDPVVDVEQAIMSPQRWNIYSFCVNNPLNVIDPTGLSAKSLDDDQISSGGIMRTPARGGPPNGRMTFPDGEGGKTVRLFCDDGYAKKDFDYGHDHGAGAPHVHDWDWSQKSPRQRGRSLSDEEKEELERRTILPSPYDLIPAHKPIPITVKQAAVGVTIGVILYWTISEGLRILCPPRNLIPVP